MSPYEFGKVFVVEGTRQRRIRFFEHFHKSDGLGTRYLLIMSFTEDGIDWISEGFKSDRLRLAKLNFCIIQILTYF